jgi:hypothetical protein
LGSKKDDHLEVAVQNDRAVRIVLLVMDADRLVVELADEVS